MTAEKKIQILAGGTGDYTAQTIIVSSASRGRVEKQLLETITLDPVRWIRREACGAITREPNRRGYRLCHPSQVFFVFNSNRLATEKPARHSNAFYYCNVFSRRTGSVVYCYCFFFFLIKNRKHVVGREYKRRPLPTTNCVYMFQHRDLPRAAQTPSPCNKQHANPIQ